MRIQADPKGCQGHVLFPQDRKCLDQSRTSDVHVVISCSTDHVKQSTFQVLNNTILRHIQSIEMVCKKLSEAESIDKNDNLEKIVAFFIDEVNDLLRIIDKARNYHAILTSMGNDTIQDSLQRLSEIITSMSVITGKEDLLNFSSSGIKPMKDGLFKIENESIREAISSNGNKVAKNIKTVSATLLDKMPSFIDPNTCNFLYIGRKLKEEGDDNTSRVSETLSERLEKERIELVKKLNITESLISRSGQFIENFKISPELFSGDV